MARLTRRIILSRRLNLLLGGADEMLCARAHRNDWRVAVVLIDALFIVLQLRVHRHCQDMATWERVYGRRQPTPKINGKKDP